MAKRVTTSERLAMEILTGDLRETNRAYEAAFREYRRFLGEPLLCAPGSTHGVLVGRVRETDKAAQAAAQMWVAEYVALRGVTKRWARQHCLAMLVKMGHGQHRPF